MWKPLRVVLFVAVLVVAGCGSDDTATDDTTTTEDTTDTTTTDTTTTDTTAADTTTADTTAAADTTADDSMAADGTTADLQLASTELGDLLVDADGNTLYLFATDEQSDSVCYDQCEASWPVVGELTTVGDGVDASLLGSIERTTGDTQATYNGWPLYYFANDNAPGDVNGQAVNDVWYVLDGAGNPITG